MATLLWVFGSACTYSYMWDVVLKNSPMTALNVKVTTHSPSSGWMSPLTLTCSLMWWDYFSFQRKRALKRERRRLEQDTKSCKKQSSGIERQPRVSRVCLYIIIYSFVVTSRHSSFLSNIAVMWQNIQIHRLMSFSGISLSKLSWCFCKYLK